VGALCTAQVVPPPEVGVAGGFVAVAVARGREVAVARVRGVAVGRVVAVDRAVARVRAVAVAVARAGVVAVAVARAGGLVGVAVEVPPQAPSFRHQLSRLGLNPGQAAAREYIIV
jgi:hypothetical protein